MSLHVSAISPLTSKAFLKADFGDKFAQFLEGLDCANLSLSYCYNGKHQWVSESRDVIIESPTHPALSKGHLSQLSVISKKQNVELIESILKRYATFEGSVKQNVDELLDYKSELNPVMWSKKDDDYVLDKDVAKKLKFIATAFMEFIETPGIKVEDVVLTGSSANFNWTKHSDIDLHIVVSYKDMTDKFGSLFESFVAAQKTLWNSTHSVEINGFPVEVYVQDNDGDLVAQGVYSINQSKWLSKPVHEKPSTDSVAVVTKVKDFTRQINHVINHSTSQHQVELLQDKIYKMRKAGLDKQGEFSVENLTFKALRNDGLIDKLNNCKAAKLDKTLSL